MNFQLAHTGLQKIDNGCRPLYYKVAPVGFFVIADLFTLSSNM